MTNFHVGQKVVCVDDDTREPYDDGTVHAVTVIKGQIYTIRATGAVKFRQGYELGLWLEGVYRPDPDGFKADEPYGASRFRPVAEKPTAMDIIRACVLDPHKPIPADPREPVITPVPEYEQGVRL